MLNKMIDEVEKIKLMVKSFLKADLMDEKNKFKIRKKYNLLL